ncbi:BA75_00409T0 [Komagataella pastoris]|uniref:Ribosomal RNA-processing protein 41 n=1 Tax=Komagataella pastoris TaxID=4922 RepID=A0A1B2J8K1_PICPA|nr:BA75_00409T0 [Komagataella pastoris]
MELYSPEGLRVDGRRWNELRRFYCRINTHPIVADGSAYVEAGNTKIVCLLNGPHEPTRSQMNTQRGSLDIKLHVSPFSTTERRKSTRNDRRIQELSTILKNTFEQVVILKNYPRTIIEVDVRVLAQDGGLLASCCNAITLALVDAGIALYDYVSAVSAGVFDNQILLDLNRLEEQDLSSVTIGVVGKTKKLSLVLSETRLPQDRLAKVFEVAVNGCHQLKEQMDAQVAKKGREKAITEGLKTNWVP